MPAAPSARLRFDHHLDTLSVRSRELAALDDFARRYQYLADAYTAAGAYWPRVQQLTRATPGANAWVEQLSAGLDRYAVGEGFIRPVRPV